MILVTDVVICIDKVMEDIWKVFLNTSKGSHNSTSEERRMAAEQPLTTHDVLCIKHVFCEEFSTVEGPMCQLLHSKCLTAKRSAVSSLVVLRVAS